MKRQVIAVLIGAIIVFVYSALSWMVLPTHKNAMKYTAAQEQILQAAQGMEEGVYMIPGMPPGQSHEEHQAAMEANEGKPWAMFTWHPAQDMMSMGPSMAMGFFHDLLSLIILVWVLTRAASSFASFSSRFLLSLSFGVFTLVNSTMEEILWFHLPWHFASGEVVDHIVTWALCGLWLGWYLKPKA